MSSKGGQRDLAKGSRPQDDHHGVVGHPGGQDSVDATRRGLHHDGRRVIEVVGNPVELGGVGGERGGPATASVVARAGLDARLQVSERGVLAVAEVAVGARRAGWLQVAAHAA